MSLKIKVLVLEDNPTDAALMERELRCAGFEPECLRVETEEAFLKHLTSEVDLVLSDYSLPQYDGFQALERVRESGLDLPFILVSGSLGEETAVAAMRKGAADYLLKDRLTRLGQAARQALEQARMRKEQKAMAEVLQRTEARYRDLFENTIEGIFQTTPEGKILTANPALARLLGYPSPEELIQSVADLQGQIYPDSLSRSEMIRRISKEYEISGYEAQVKRRDGTLVWVAVNARVARSDQGQILHIDGTMEDISRRKQLESQLLRAQRLESVGRLAGGIAHDLNNLLSPILMAPSLLRGRLPDASSQKLLDAIEASARRGAEIIRQLLTFSRGSEGSMRPLQLSELMSDMIKIMQETFPRNIAILKDFPVLLPPVNGDPTQLEQVVMNLCVNARDAMTEGGRLMVSLEPVEVDEDLASLNPDARPGDYVLLRVTDTGMGIKPEILDVIFDPFFTTKELGKGTGLGLSTVIGIVKSHHGFIQVSSLLGRGTQFQIYIPVSGEGAVRPPADATGALPSGAGELILVAEDEQMTRHLARKILERSGYRVVEATNGAQALVQFMKFHGEISLVITDALMPEMDGLDFLKQLRSQGFEVPVLLVTEMHHAIHPEEYQIEGTCGLLRKPFTGLGLSKAVREALGSLSFH
jgi:two-component system cell cycle sensor histidine kinase/response regulator CckA